MDSLSQSEHIEGAAVLAAWPRPAKLDPRVPWSEREKAIMREHYPVGGLAACRAHLAPLRGDGAIYQMAQQLGLKAPGQPVLREQWTTTPHIDEAIRRAYIEDGRKGCVARVARKIARPPRWVSHRARQLGIVPPRFREPPWTEREFELLRANATKQPYVIARIFARHGFRRTGTAIKIKLTRLKIDRTDDNTYTSRGLAELMGVESHRVSTWIAKGWLKAKRKSDLPGSEFQIQRRDIRAFIIDNVGAIDIRRVDKHWFVDLVAGSDRVSS